MDPEDVGGAFTGQSAAGVPPRVDPAQASGQWDDWLNRPGNRSALLQMGLQLMQPVGIGQTAGGAIAQGIGAGGEAVARGEAEDLKQQMADSKLAVADERLRIAQQQADANTLRATSAAARAANRKIGGLTDAIRSRYARQDAQNYEKTIEAEAKAIEERVKDPLTKAINADDPELKEYAGLTREQIRQKVRARTPKPKFGAIPSSDDTGDEGDTTGDGPTPPTAPAGFEKYSDGNYYKPDPSNPGKVLRWRP